MAVIKEYLVMVQMEVIQSITNLVSNTGVVASDQAATTGTVRQALGGM